MALARNVCTSKSNVTGMCCTDGDADLDRAELKYCRCKFCFGPVFDDFPSDVTAPVTEPPKQTRLLQGDSAYRKEFPMCTGLLDYFPDALAEVSRVSYLGNAKHNPGKPLHHARGKSMDHADCIVRHVAERGGFDVIVINGEERRVRHSAAAAWRALALCQEEIEQELSLPLPRGASND